MPGNYLNYLKLPTSKNLLTVWSDKQKIVALNELRQALLLNRETGDAKAEIEMAYSVFKAIDADDSGTVDYRELTMGLIHLGVRFSRRKLRLIWSFMDPAGT